MDEIKQTYIIDIVQQHYIDKIKYQYKIDLKGYTDVLNFNTIKTGDYIKYYNNVTGVMSPQLYVKEVMKNLKGTTHSFNLTRRGIIPFNISPEKYVIFIRQKKSSALTEAAKHFLAEIK